MTNDLDKDTIEELKRFAGTLADAAAAVSMRYFRKTVPVEDKGNATWFDPVTKADREAEAAIRALIEDSYPDHGIFGEEYGIKDTGGPFEWVLDPIDGTRAFISGLPTWGTLIALRYDGEPVIGIIDQPYLRERYLGWDFGDMNGDDMHGGDMGGGMRGATLNGDAIVTRACATLENATLATTDADLFKAQERALFDGMRDKAKLVRYGMDCYAYAIVASGHMDAVAETGLQPYDMMALIPVVRGAGGVAVNWHGDSPGEDGRLIAAGDVRLADAMLAITRQL